MVLSLKPFGCMPSTQSDGAQSAVVSNYKDMIYLPVETSGEGEINAHSRVQMALGEAKNKAKKEFAEALEQSRPDAGRMPRLGGSASRNQAAHVPGAAHQGHTSVSAANFVHAHRGADESRRHAPSAERELAAVAN